MINKQYTDVVKDFELITSTKNEPFLSSQELTAVINEVAEKIIAASQIRLDVEMMLQCKLSLQDTSYLITQDKDSKNNQNTAEKIANAPEGSQVIAGHIVKILAKDFEQLTQEDLKVCTLLFGITRISNLAVACHIALPPAISPTEQMKAELNKLISIRNQYPAISDEMPEAIRQFLTQVDAMIEKQQRILLSLKEEAPLS